MFGLDLLNYLPVVVFVVFIFFACRLQKVFKCMFKKENDFNMAATIRSNHADAGQEIIDMFMDHQPLYDIIERQGKKSNKKTNLMTAVVEKRLIK